ncbi:hypothetical protein [Actinokineospora pegani]|uniref:hypothetical protein n=1 Tax=Actinokineospora pegani TaxID=2654637 RepID=UPI0012EA77CB|nr:hypothetical protein [Actinokineospora pegani]
MTGAHDPDEPPKFGGIPVRTVVIYLLAVGIAAFVGAAAQESPTWGVLEVLAEILTPSLVVPIVTASAALAVHTVLQRRIR